MRNLIRLIVKHYFVLLFLFLEGLGMILIFQFNPFQRSFVVNISRSFSGNLGSKLNNVRDYFFLEENIRILNEENLRLKQELQNSSKTVYINIPDSSIIDTLSIDKENRFRFIPAEVVSNSINKQYNYITLNKGRKANVRADMAVLSGNGVVGMVLNCSENFATVLPLINRNSRTGAKIRGKDYFGIIEWDGTDPGIVNLTEIPVHVSLELGDTVETSGYSSVFPKGRLIGEIQSFEKGEGNFYDIEVKLATDFRILNHVVIIPNILREEQKSLEGGEVL